MGASQNTVMCFCLKRPCLKPGGGEGVAGSYLVKGNKWPTCPESQWLESRRGERTTSPWRDFLAQVRVEGVAHPQNPNSPPLPDLRDHRTTPILTKTCQVLTSFILLMSQSILSPPDPSLLAKTVSHITVYIWLQKQPPVRFLHNYCAALRAIPRTSPAQDFCVLFGPRN